MIESEAVEILLHCCTATEVLEKANVILAENPQLKESWDVARIIIDAAFNMDEQRWQHLQAVAEILQVEIKIEPYPQPGAATIYVHP